MKKISAFSRKSTQIATAGALGVALLVGGGTYALWTSSVTSNTAATITNGDLKVTASAAQSWSDVTDTANPKTITTLSSYRLAPGSTIKLNQVINTVIVGDNLKANLNVALPNTTTGAALTQGNYTVRVLDGSTVLGTATKAANATDGSLSVALNNLTPTGASGRNLTVEITVALPSSADNNTKNTTINLDNVTATLTQVG